MTIRAEESPNEMITQEHHDLDPRPVRQPSLLRVFGICLVAVATLFLGYEIVERTWLTGVNPEILHALHLLRGFSASAIAATLATILLLRQTGQSSTREALLPAWKTWKQRLQHVTLRTKIVVPMVALASVPAMAIGIFTTSHTRDSLQESAVQRLEFDTSAKARVIEEFLRMVEQDLRFLAQLKPIRDLANAEAAGAVTQIPLLRREAERELLIFSQGKRAYYQVRYLNAAGREVVRLNVENGLPWIVPPDRLQDKIDRYYVKAALGLEPGEIYISPMDMNVEYGKVEVPHRSVVRYALRVTSDDGNEQGFVVINIYAGYLFSLVGPLATGAEGWLVDEDGTYLGFMGESQEKRGWVDLANRRQLSTDYGPDVASVILREHGAGHTVESSGAFLSFARVKYDESLSDDQWTLIIAHPRGPVEAPIRYLTVFLLVVTALVTAASSVIGVLVAHYLARPLASLRRATREVAAGNLSNRVEITTGDELEALALDFNTMTDRLREAHERLAVWNVELEREVARKTEHAHQLQVGLARADKMAAIGQMTAGILHEVGNPLAAIKTKIQVAEEEEGALCGDCRTLVSEVVSEVDRLAAFLRGFSRFSRFRESALKDLTVSEILQGVVLLIAPELRKRGLSLRTEVPSDLPAIRGDADQLRQLLINLVLNAAEASPEGGEILVRTRPGDPAVDATSSPGFATIDIVDHGVGMSPEVLEKIGDSFFTTKPDGTGLGLAICRQIVRDHGGTMRIESKPSQGTTVTLVFPASVAGPSKPEPPERPSQASGWPLENDR